MFLRFCRAYQPRSNGRKYILICTDYVIKWVEEKDLLKELEISVVDFLFEDIITHFGVPI